MCNHVLVTIEKTIRLQLIQSDVFPPGGGGGGEGKEGGVAETR